MHTIIPTFFLVVIFAATVWGCGTETDTNLETKAKSTQVERSNQLGKVQIEPAPRVAEPAVLTTGTQPQEPESLLQAPTPKMSDTTGELRVERLALSRSIADREPVEAGLFFNLKDEKLFAFVEMANEGPEARSIFVTFRHESGFTAGLVELEIPAHSPRWRTWAFSRNVQLSGLWTLVIEDEDASVLDSVDFEMSDSVDSL